MISNKFVNNIEVVKSVFASIGLAIDVEQDKNNTGNIDCEIELGDIELERDGDVSLETFNIRIIISSHKKYWKDFLLKTQALTERFGSDTNYLFGGWTKVDDDTKLIYTGQIAFKGYTNESILS